MILKKALCLSMAIAMLSLTACKEEKNGSVRLEYGKNMVSETESNLPFSIEFDNHFLTNEEADAIVNYYYSIEKQDEELAKQNSYPAYLDYLTKTYDFGSVKDFLKSNYDTMGNVLETDNYEFKNIKITSCVTEQDKDVYSYFDEIDELLDASAEGTSSKIEKRKLVEADITCTVDGKDISLTEKAGAQQLYIYTIDGKPYVL